MQSVGSPLMWVAFVTFVAIMLALDLGVFHKKAHEISVKEASIWTCVWIALALAFNGWVAYRFGAEVGHAFLTGYLIEKALSVDNLFVFYLIFATFRVPLAHQHRLLFWGIIGALILRAGMVVGGSYLLSRFHWLVYLFGAVLIATGVRMFVRRDEELHPEQSRPFRWVQKVIPTTTKPDGQKLFVRDAGRLMATPFFLVLVLIELTDVVFALDSILAIFAITEDPFIVFTSNVFAVLGLRSLYFVLATMARRFDYLQPGLALVLIFVGLKMALSEIYKLPVLVSLAIVFFMLGGSIVASMIKTRREKRRERERTT
jgi:tellurite resistance protein TerC